jgi:hypothetical protein
MFPIINYGQHTDQINSNRPGETMSAFAVGSQLSNWKQVFTEQRKPPFVEYDATGFGLDLTLRYGALWLELIADLQYKTKILPPL